jgi:hypothetical protein
LAFSAAPTTTAARNTYTAKSLPSRVETNSLGFLKLDYRFAHLFPLREQDWQLGDVADVMSPFVFPQ